MTLPGWISASRAGFDPPEVNISVQGWISASRAGFHLPGLGLNASKVGFKLPGLDLSLHSSNPALEDTEHIVKYKHLKPSRAPSS